jgi:hypothetical protein
MTSWDVVVVRRNVISGISSGTYSEPSPEPPEASPWTLSFFLRRSLSVIVAIELRCWLLLGHYRGGIYRKSACYLLNRVILYLSKDLRAMNETI